MRIRAVAILVCIVQAAFLDNAPTTQAERPKLSVGLPRIDVIYPPYGTVFDRTCSEFLREADLKPEWINEAGKLRSALQKEWDNEGPKYLSIIFEEIGLPFPYLEMQAVLTVCSINTMSMPLLINVRSLLPAAPHRPPPGDFTEKVFHELMHHYVEPVHSSSALRKKYAATPPSVVNHLHVMALEKLALLRLGKSEELKYLDQLYRTDPAPSHYKRAWEIVNETEGYEAFIKELKAVASR